MERWQDAGGHHPRREVRVDRIIGWDEGLGQLGRRPARLPAAAIATGGPAAGFSGTDISGQREQGEQRGDDDFGGFADPNVAGKVSARNNMISTAPE